jgi:cytidylate kinase
VSVAAGRTSPVVAIDGPAGVGKSTTARLVAKRLGFTLVDTGAIYRAVALSAEERGLAFDDGASIATLARSLELELGQHDDGTTRVVIGGHDRSADIRRHDISMGASIVSKHPPVRMA